MAGLCASWWGFIFAAWMIIFPILIDEQRVATRLDFQGSSIIIRKEGTAEWRTKKKCWLFKHILVPSSWFIWSDQPLVDDDHRLVGRFCLASFFSCKIYKSKLERRKPQGQLLRIHPVRYILKSWRNWRMDTLQGLRQKPVRVGKQASQFYIPSASKIYLHSPLWTSLSKIEWTRKMMGFVKGHAFQRYGYLRVSGHDFTPKMLGLPLQTHKLTSKKKKSRQKFPGWWFQIFFYPTWGNDPIWLTIFSNGLKPATRF